MAGPDLRRALLEFEIALDAAAADEVRTEDWGRTFLSPSLPLIWDASYIALEGTGIGLASVEDLADRALGAAGFAHRTVVVVDEAAGRRLAAEAEAVAGWEAERTRYMVWRGAAARDAATAGGDEGAVDEGAVRTKEPSPGKSANGPGVRESPGVREMSPPNAEPLRRALLEELTPKGDGAAAMVQQLLDYGRRLGEAGEVRWFVAPDDGPGAACCLLRNGAGIGQVEDVATLEAARGHGLATAIVDAARTASQQAGDTTTFITADAADWPQFLYEKLGFTAVGDLHVLRRRPNPCISERD